MNQLYPMIRRVRRPLWPVAAGGVMLPVGTKERPAAGPPAVERGEPEPVAPREPAEVCAEIKSRSVGKRA